MEKIIFEFSASPCLYPTKGVNVIMTLNEKGKNYTIESNNLFADLTKELFEKLEEKQEEQPSLPKRVLDAFTENAINKILSKDEIPNESGMVVLDGNSYEIKITKGDICKEYDADDASIETYPLLRYLASWYKNKKCSLRQSK